MNSIDLLLDLRRRGIRLESRGENIRFHPRQAVTPALLERMRTHKAGILEFLERYEERAAIIEFDGGLSRSDAEELAWTECCST